MSSGNPLINPSRSISLPGLLSTICGWAVIFVYLKFKAIADLTQNPSWLLLFSAGALLSLWGTKQILVSYFPSLSKQKYRKLNRHRVSLPRAGFFYLLIMTVLFVGAMIGRSNLLMLVFAMMAGPFVTNGWLMFTMLRRTQASRKIPERISAGEIFSVELTLSNHKFWFSSWLMVLGDFIHNDQENLEASVVFDHIPARDKRVGHYQLRLMQRGRYHFGPLNLSTRFPLGIGERGLLFEAQDSLLVHPKIGYLTSKWNQKNFAATELAEQQKTSRGMFDDEVHSLREFRGGDNPRAIHWRTSARRNELMVREYHQSRDHDLTLYLDLWIPQKPSEDDLERVELAVSFAATVGLAHFRSSNESKITLLAVGKRDRQWEGQASPINMNSLMDLLAVVKAGPCSGLDLQLDHLKNQNSLKAKSLFITTRNLAEISEPNSAQQKITQAINLTGHSFLLETSHDNLSSYIQFD